jgi:hypothetical protein
MGKSTISMAIFNSFLYVYQRENWDPTPKSGDIAKGLTNRSE